MNRKHSIEYEKHYYYKNSIKLKAGNVHTIDKDHKEDFKENEAESTVWIGARRKGLESELPVSSKELVEEFENLEEGGFLEVHKATGGNIEKLTVLDGKGEVDWDLEAKKENLQDIEFIIKEFAFSSKYSEIPQTYVHLDVTPSDLGVDPDYFIDQEGDLKIVAMQNFLKCLNMNL